MLELLQGRGSSASIQSQFDLALGDIDILQQMPGAAVSVTVSFRNDEDRRRFEDNTIKTGARLTVISHLKQARIRTRVLSVYRFKTNEAFF